MNEETGPPKRDFVLTKIIVPIFCVILGWILNNFLSPRSYENNSKELIASINADYEQLMVEYSAIEEQNKELYEENQVLTNKVNELSESHDVFEHIYIRYEWVGGFNTFFTNEDKYNTFENYGFDSLAKEDYQFETNRMLISIFNESEKPLYIYKINVKGDNHNIVSFQRTPCWNKDYIINEGYLAVHSKAEEDIIMTITPDDELHEYIKKFVIESIGNSAYSYLPFNERANFLFTQAFQEYYSESLRSLSFIYELETITGEIKSEYIYAIEGGK